MTHDDQGRDGERSRRARRRSGQREEQGTTSTGQDVLVDFEQGRLIPDEELKTDVAGRRSYNQWLQNQRVELSDVVENCPAQTPRVTGDALLEQMQAFGYSTETLQFMLVPLINAKKDPINSMGDDASLACLSDKPRLLYDYFKQLFAQVTNPAIDSIREEVIMSLECYIGPEGNLLDTTEQQCHRLRVPHPILTDEETETAGIKALDGYRGWKTKTIDVTFDKSEGTDG